MKCRAIERVETAEGVLLRPNGSGEPTVFFVPKTMRLFDVEQPFASETLASLQHRIGNPQCPAIDPQINSSVPGGNFNLRRRQALLPIYAGKPVSGIEARRAHIGRLTLNISNSCNLWCSYCYADHGFYHAPKSFMAPGVAVEIMNRVLEAYGSIGTVHFFGGEPLLNLPAIDAVGNFLEASQRSGRISTMPVFVATTNGTLSSHRVISTLRRWNISLTVSWDGPQSVHDQNRPTGNGKSSYEAVARSIERFVEAGIPYEIECTYNKSHLEANLSVADLLQYFHRETGKRIFHIAPAALPPPAKEAETDSQRIFRDAELVRQSARSLRVDELTPLFAEAARATVESFFAGTGPMLALAEDVILRILEQKPNHTYCPAFFTQLSIATDGSVYPCFMFIGDPAFRFGNILTDEFPTKTSHAVLDRYFREFGESPVGTERWYAPLFGGCVAGDYIMSSNLGTRALAPMYEEVISECLVGVARYAISQSTTSKEKHHAWSRH